MKTFSKQFRECKKNGNLIKIDVSNYNEVTDLQSFPLKIIFVCLRFKKVCISGVCKHLRE